MKSTKCVTSSVIPIRYGSSVKWRGVPNRWERRVRTEDLCMAEICFEGGIRGIYESDLPEPVLRGDVVYGDDGQLRRAVTMAQLNCLTAKPKAGRLSNLAKVNRINLMRCSIGLKGVLMNTAMPASMGFAQ